MQLDTNGMQNIGKLGIDKIEFSIEKRHFANPKSLTDKLKRHGYWGSIAKKDASINRIWRDWSTIHFSLNVDRMRSTGDSLDSVFQRFAGYFNQEFGMPLSYEKTHLSYIEFFMDQETEHDHLNYRLIQDYLHLPYKKYEHNHLSTAYRENRSGGFTFYDKFAEIQHKKRKRNESDKLPPRISRMEFRLTGKSKEFKRFGVVTVLDALQNADNFQQSLFGEVKRALLAMERSIPQELVCCESIEAMTSELHNRFGCKPEMAYLLAVSNAAVKFDFEHFVSIMHKVVKDAQNRHNAIQRMRLRVEQVQAMLPQPAPIHYEKLRQEILYKFVDNRVRGYDLAYAPDFERALKAVSRRVSIGNEIEANQINGEITTIFD